MSELKPCPFCGSTDVRISPYDGGKAAICMDCLCQSPMYRGDNALDEAIAAWNRRAQPTNEPLTLEQLREMDGEPVWCEIPQDNPQYGIVKMAFESVWLPTCVLQFKYYGEWLAYRRKPERNENDG